MRPSGLGLITLGATLAFAPSVAAAADDLIPTDRPSLSSSTVTVPPGALQIESGVDYSRSRLSHGQDQEQVLIDVLMRTGITNRLEARLDINPLVWLKEADTNIGFGDLTLALKYRFLDSPEGSRWPALGVLPFVKLPTARSPIGSERLDFGCTALATFDLPWDLSLDVNVGLVGLGQSCKGPLSCSRRRCLPRSPARSATGGRCTASSSTPRRRRADLATSSASIPASSSSFSRGLSSTWLPRSSGARPAPTLSFARG